ncbi:MAG: hypothetical protein ABIO85_08905 [Sphingomicrobium sp.]
MTLYRHYVAAALIVTPLLASGAAQAKEIPRVVKQKQWLPANFRTFDCAVGPGPSLSASGTLSFDEGDAAGIELAVTSGLGGLPSVLAHAIKTKGAGANDRSLAQSCTTQSADGSIASGTSCSLSGDSGAPNVRFTLPLSALGDDATAKNYVGHVTLIKQRIAAGGAGSKKGYDYYQAQSDMAEGGSGANPLFEAVARCDRSALASKGGKPSLATYDLAVAKK